jgi:hypothetical protein
MRVSAEVKSMGTERHIDETEQSRTLAAAMPNALDSIFHESWSCGHCGRQFPDCTSCVAHEEQCGGRLTRW